MPTDGNIFWSPQKYTLGTQIKVRHLCEYVNIVLIMKLADVTDIIKHVPLQPKAAQSITLSPSMSGAGPLFFPSYMRSYIKKADRIG